LIEKPTLDPEERVVSLNDVKQLYISMWRRLVKWALLGGIGTVLFFGNSNVTYKAEASFKEGVERNSSENFFKELMGGITAANQPQATSFMKSYQVLKPLVETMGVQIVSTRSEWALTKLIRRYKESWRAEKGLPLKDPDRFEFVNVRYEGEVSIPFSLVFSDREHFTVFGEKKKELCKGEIGREIQFEKTNFTLKKVPDPLKFGSTYPFSVQNWVTAVGSLRGQIDIKNDKDNPSVIHISAVDRNRHYAKEVVNELMRQYQCYLKREHDQIAKDQLAYLEGKQEQIIGKMENLFDEHTAYLSRNLEENGFIGLEQESQSLLVPHQNMYAKVLSIEVELSRLNQIECGKEPIIMAEEGPFSHGLNLVAQKIHELKQERDLIELSLCQVTGNALQARSHELREVRNQRLAVESLIQEVDQGGEISSFDFNVGLCKWAQTLTDPEEREDLAEYLENYSRILSMREKMIQERFFYGENAPTELDGIDLASARSLFRDYNGRLDAVEAAMRHYAQYKKEIPNPHFDLASLSSVLKDPLCQKIISEASELGLQLKDEKHHSAKEAERWKEEISLHRNILMDHIEHLYQVEELNANLIKEKMAGLQKVSLDCIHRQISVLHEQVADGIKERRQALLLEKEILEEKMESIRAALAKILPEKWRFEKWLSIKTAMVNKVMETVTEVVESKTISTHLHHVESKPLDAALTPAAPQPPRLYMMGWLGAFAFPFLIFSFAFIRQFIHGFPANLEKLKALRLPVLGPISAFCDGPSVDTPSGPDLDLLRNISLFSEGGKVISLLVGRGPDYSYALGENIGRRHAKSIIVRCDFHSKFRKEDAPGILQVWKSEIAELPIRKGKGFDYILSGGYTPYGTEIVQSTQFSQLLELLKKNYDWVFLLFRTPLSSAESLTALRLCDKAVVTVSGEKTEELTPFIHWGYDEDRCRLTFITRI